MQPPAAASTYRAALRIRRFRWLVLGTATSELGDWLYNVALLVYVFERTESAVWVGLATIGRMLPAVLLGPLGGVIADRFDRLQVMMASNLIRLVVFAGMTVAVAIGADAPVVIVLAMVATVASAPYRPASTALLPDLVGTSLLAPAMALLSTLFSVALVAGPALGALILTAGSPSIAFAANAASFGISTIFLLHVRTRPAETAGVTTAGAGGEPEPTVSAWRMFVDGVIAIRTTPYVPVVAIQLFAGTVGYGAETVLLVVYAQERLGIGADGYGYLMAAAGVGGVLAGVVAGRLAGRSRVAWTMTGAAVVACLGAIGYAFTDHLLPALLVAGLAGAGLVVADVVSDVAITRAASGGLLGRIYGGLDGLGMAGTVIGALICPVVLGWIGLTPTLLLFGGLAVAMTLLPLPRLLQMDGAIARSAAAVAERADLLGEVGFLTGASRPALEQMASAADDRVAETGAVVIAQGERADAFYVVLDGRLEVLFAEDDSESARQVAQLGQHAWFGEIGLIEHRPRTATVRALDRCRLLRIDGETFLNVLTANPAGSGPLRSTLATRLERTHPNHLLRSHHSPPAA